MYYPMVDFTQETTYCVVENAGSDETVIWSERIYSNVVICSSWQLWFFDTICKHCWFTYKSQHLNMYSHSSGKGTVTVYYLSSKSDIMIFVNKPAHIFRHSISLYITMLYVSIFVRLKHTTRLITTWFKSLTSEHSLFIIN